MFSLCGPERLHDPTRNGGSIDDCVDDKIISGQASSYSFLMGIEPPTSVIREFDIVLARFTLRVPLVAANRRAKWKWVGKMPNNALRMPFTIVLCLSTVVSIACRMAVGQQPGDVAWQTTPPQRQDQPGLAPPRIVLPQEDCPSLAELGYRSKQLRDISLDVAIRDQQLPADCSKELFALQRPHPAATYRHAAGGTLFWAASGLYHQPLYFDDTVLERYGQSYPALLQPWVSGAHFFGTFPIIPYKIGLDGTHDKVYALGYDRPGSPTPCLRRRLPFEFRAAGLEAATWLGLIFLLP